MDVAALSLFGCGPRLSIEELAEAASEAEARVMTLVQLLRTERRIGR